MKSSKINQDLRKNLTKNCEPETERLKAQWLYLHAHNVFHHLCVKKHRNEFQIEVIIECFSPLAVIIKKYVIFWVKFSKIVTV